MVADADHASEWRTAPVKSDALMTLRASNILVTGAAGMLGTAFVESLASDYDGCNVLDCGREELDVTDADSVLRLASWRPDVIIHCAADTNADRCERDPSGCWNVQVGGTRNVVDLAIATGATVVYPQSFLIFSEGQHLVDAGSPPNPLSVYGRHKLESEAVIRCSSVRSLVVRMGGFFGGDAKDKNFVGKFTRKVASLLAAGDTEYAVGDRVWQPTYTSDAARNTLLLLENGHTGVWSMASEGEASFFELAEATVTLLGLGSRFRVMPAEREVIRGGDIATRPHRVVLSNEQLKSAGLCIQRPWRVALAEYLQRPWFRELFHDFS
jgi:dTDP-4-dehydrorhamnose reductase